MSDPQGLGQGGFELLGSFEAGPGGGLATTPYMCAGGRLTLGLGATEWPNGDPVKATDICTLDQAQELTNWSVRKFAKVVDDAVKVPITINERDAMILMAYNIGPEAFANCSVVTRLNANPRDRLHAAGAFAMWCKATNDRPEKYDLDDAYYQQIMKQNLAGQWRWIGPKLVPPAGYEVVRDGEEFVAIHKDDPTTRVPLGWKFCRYQRTYPGLLRRHLSEAMLFLGLDWRQACRKDTVSITSYRVWDPKDNRWEDLVRKKTEVSDVEPVARGYPLPESYGLAEPYSPIPAPSPDLSVEIAGGGLPDSALALPLPDDALFERDELVLEKTAKVQKPVSNTGASPPASRPAPASTAPPTSPAGAGVSSSAKVAPSVAPPKPPPIIGPQPINPNALPTNADASKNMADSTRMTGMILVGIGTVVQVLTLRLGIGTAFGAVFFDLTRDPVVITLAVTTIVGALGWVTKRNGKKTFSKGADQSKGGLY